MKNSKKVRVTQIFHEHSYLHSIALNQIEQARKEQDGHRFRWIIPAMAFSVFRVEALCNIYGQHLFPHWRHFEATSFLGKVTLISEFLGLTVDFSVEPWQTINKMKSFRNALAHAKPQKLTQTFEVPTNYPEKLLFVEQKKTILSYSSIETAEAFESVTSDLERIWSYNAMRMNKPIAIAGSRTFEILPE